MIIQDEYCVDCVHYAVCSSSKKQLCSLSSCLTKQNRVCDVNYPSRLYFHPDIEVCTLVIQEEMEIRKELGLCMSYV